LFKVKIIYYDISHYIFIYSSFEEQNFEMYEKISLSSLELTV